MFLLFNEYYILVAFYFMWKSQYVCFRSSQSAFSWGCEIRLQHFHIPSSFFNLVSSTVKLSSPWTFFLPHAPSSFTTHPLLFQSFIHCEVVIKLLREFELETFCSIDSKSFFLYAFSSAISPCAAYCRKKKIKIKSWGKILLVFFCF